MTTVRFRTMILWYEIVLFLCLLLCECKNALVFLVWGARHVSNNISISGLYIGCLEKRRKV